MPREFRPPRILQLDADAYYVQVARLLDPAGAGSADLVLVGGSPHGRGVVTSASYGARAYGVRSGMSMAQALERCPDAMVVGVPRGACGKTSKAIVAVLEQFTPVVEPASIDEMYLDMTGTETLYRDEPLEATARRIRAAVYEETGIVGSIGGGTTRLVAKLAAKRAKPHRTPEADGVIVVPPGDEETFLTQFDLADIPGIGPRFQQRLKWVGLVTVPDALQHDVATLGEWFGDRTGKWLYRRIRGIDATPIEPQRRAKSISRDETFGADISDDAALRRELLRLVDRAAADLRKHEWTARTITVRIRDYDFRTRQRSHTLAEPVVADRVIATVAKDLLRRLRHARRVPARLIGVSLSHLNHEDSVDQLSLFPAPDQARLESARDRALSRALDAVRSRFGQDAVGRAGQHD
jgi:DNA polymerase-4